MSGVQRQTRAPRPGEGRLERIETALEAHRAEDQDQFSTLRDDIARLGAALGERIEKMGTGLQAQIDGFALEKRYAEGKAAGLAEARRPGPWAIAVWPAVIGALIAGVVGLAGGGAMHPPAAAADPPAKIASP
ncbi:MAG: hypothetical protein JO127_09915 [Caulobacteraceae bacterium]|nr:hypothetical protein [Caulobacteraceae bacterium]